jgi:hypothetical protein
MLDPKPAEMPKDAKDKDGKETRVKVVVEKNFDKSSITSTTRNFL